MDFGVTILLMNRFVRDARGDSRRMPRSPGVCVGFALAMLIPASRAAVSASGTEGSPAVSGSRETRSGSPVSDRPVFRLGDAARPFGWSTVIGDFNRDGKPDSAIADHIGQRAGAGGYAYRIGFSISGQAPDDVTFESPDDAVTISLSDIDHDDDLDIIVGRPLSGDTVGVWLNDGHGHFTSGDVRQYPAAMRPLPTLGTTDPVVDPAAFELPPRRTHDGLPAVFRAALSGSDHRINVSPGHCLWFSSPLLRTGPRAPPSSSVDFLS